MINPLHIIREVEEGFFLQKGSIRAKKRGKVLDEARCVAMLVCRTTSRFSYPELGLIFQKDQSTVRSGVRTARRIKRLKEIADKLSKICLQKYDNGL